MEIDRDVDNISAVTDGVLHAWKVMHIAIDKPQDKIFWHLPSTDLAWMSCAAIIFFIIGRNLLSKTKVQWYHAASTVKLKLNPGSELQLSELCKAVTPPCFLNPLMRNSHLQTLYFMFDRRAFPIYFRRAIFNSTNQNYQGSFAVDFSAAAFSESDPELPPRTAYHNEQTLRTIASDDSKPMLVVLHGLCGGSHEQYIQHVLAPLIAGKQQWEACVVLSRGCGQSNITGGGMYYAHATSDIRQVVDWLRMTFPNRPLYGAGFSMGANILTRYVAEEGQHCAFKTAVVVSNPWNLEITALHLQRTFWGRWLYSPAMTANLMKVYYRHAEKIETIAGRALKRIPSHNVKLMHEYDRQIQCPTWGFPTERAYYRQASSSDAVLKVQIPFWAINSEDDPIVGPESIPYGEFQVSPYTVMCTTEEGGHLGWFQPDGKRWYANAMVSFYEKMHAVQETTV